LVLASGRNDWFWFPALPLNSLFSSYHRLDTSLPAAYAVLSVLSFLGFFPNEAAKGSRLSTLLYNHTVQLLQNVGMPCPHFVLTPRKCCTSLRLTARRALVLGFLALLILCNCVSTYLRKLIDVTCILALRKHWRSESRLRVISHNFPRLTPIYTRFRQHSL
jgi:hypothetical protein